MRDIGDADLIEIGRLTRLERLDLSGTSITDAGVAHLRGCDALRDVNLSWTATGDGALRALAGRPHLHTFRSGNGVTDAGIALLHEWPVFKTWQGGPEHIPLLDPTPSPNLLWLRGPFTDHGLEQLRGLDGLFALNLDDARLALTAACLTPLRDLPRLASLAVDAKDDWMPAIARCRRCASSSRRTPPRATTPGSRWPARGLSSRSGVAAVTACGGAGSSRCPTCRRCAGCR